MITSKLTNTPPTLGFGFMRLPEADGIIDLEQVKRMVEKYIDAGFNYMDTAWGYHNGQSEEIVRQAVVERYPRESVQIATKFPIWAVEKESDVQRIFDTQLERTGAQYFDFYLIHAIDTAKLPKLDQYKVWDFIKEQQAKGLVKHIGFSFHDRADVLDDILSAHPEVEFVQLQINYADWDDEEVQARLCYDVCVKHGVAVTIMEPVKGGSLALMPPTVRELLNKARPGKSVASWAMRFCGSLNSVITVLSGMSNEQQMDDNIATMADFEALTDADRDALDRALELLKMVPTIPCTACKYCVEDCPQQINIPGIFGEYNTYLTYDNLSGARRGYSMFVANKVKASDCIECGACEARCPQHIDIIDRLKDCADKLEV